MNETLAYYLAQALLPLVGPERPISKLAGLVKTVERLNDAGKVERFPVAITPELNCEILALPDLMPNSDDRLIVYFEDNGCKALSPRKWQSNLRLVGWGNRTLLSVNGQVASPDLVARLVSSIDGLYQRVRLPAGAPIDSVRVTVTAQPESSVNLFARYTYSQTSAQYLVYPYFSFGLDLSTTFILNGNCNLEPVGAVAAGAC